MMMENKMQERDEAKEKIKQLLFEQDAVEKLRNFALQLYAEGFSEKEIYQTFLESDVELQNDGTRTPYRGFGRCDGHDGRLVSVQEY